MLISALGQNGIYIPYSEWDTIPEFGTDGRIGYWELVGFLEEVERSIKASSGENADEVHQSDIKDFVDPRGDLPPSLKETIGILNNPRRTMKILKRMQKDIR